MAGGGVGLALTPLNTAAMNAIRRIEHGAAAGVLVTMSGIGATFGVALSGAFFQSVTENKSDELLSKLGIGLTEAQEQTLSGLLAGNAEAIAELRTFPPGSRWRSSMRSSRVSPTAWAWSCGCPWASPSPG